MISLLLELVFVVGISVLAHAVIAYVLAPKRAKMAILNALTDDQDFQVHLVESILSNFLRANPDGTMPIDPIIKRAQDAFKTYIEGQQKEIEKSASEYAENMMVNQENPMLGMVLSQIPKKYRWLLPFVAQFMQKP